MPSGLSENGTDTPASVHNLFLEYGLPLPLKSALEAAELLDPGQLRSYPLSSWEALETPERAGATRQCSPISSSISPIVSSSFSSTVPPCLAGVGGRLVTGSVFGSYVVGAVVRPLSPSLVPVVFPVGPHMSVLPPVVESSTAVSGTRSQLDKKLLLRLETSHLLPAVIMNWYQWCWRFKDRQLYKRRWRVANDLMESTCQLMVQVQCEPMDLTWGAQFMEKWEVVVIQMD